MKKYFIWVVVLFCVLSMSIMGSSDKLVSANDNLRIDEAKAVIIATNHIKISSEESLSSWKTAVPSKPIPLYDFNGDIVGYGFDVLNNEEGIGYIIVGTNIDDVPIPEFGVGSGLPFLKNIANSQLLAEKSIDSDQTINPQDVKFIYPSALTYILEISSYKKQQEKSYSIY